MLMVNWIGSGWIPQLPIALDAMSSVAGVSVRAAFGWKDVCAGFGLGVERGTV